MKRNPIPGKFYSIYVQSSHGRYARVINGLIAQSIISARAQAAHYLNTHGYGREGFAVVLPNDRSELHPVGGSGTINPIAERSFYVFPGQKPIRMMDVRDYARA